MYIIWKKKEKKGGRRVSHFLMIQLFQISEISTVGRAVAWCTGDEKITGAVVQQAIYTGTVTGSMISTAACSLWWGSHKYHTPSRMVHSIARVLLIPLSHARHVILDWVVSVSYPK